MAVGVMEVESSNSLFESSPMKKVDLVRDRSSAYRQRQRQRNYINQCLTHRLNEL